MSEQTSNGPLDTANHFMVAGQGDDLVIIQLPIGRLKKDRALNLAAWLVALADPEGKEFERVLEAIRNT